MTRRITLRSPWQRFWVEVIPQRPSDWAEQVAQIASLDGREAIEAACAVARQVVSNHNVTGPGGEPSQLDPKELAPSLVESIAVAIRDAARIERALATGDWQRRRAELMN
jgi:hypothetical protein